MLSGRQIERIIASIYQCRKLRVSHPEGETRADGTWHPSDRERGAAGSFNHVKAPSRESRYSYAQHCRTKSHVRHLVERAILGFPVPDDVNRMIELGRPYVMRPAALMVPELSPDEIPDLVFEFAKFLKSKAKHSNGLQS